MRPNRFWALLRHRCPRCCKAPIFRGRLEMNPVCPVCGLDFQPEGGYFLGAMYISYPLATALLAALALALSPLLPAWRLEWLVLLAVVPFLFFVPVLFRTSRV